MSVLAQRSRAIYRVYDEQEYLAGAGDLASLEREPHHTRTRGGALAAVVLLAVGCASAGVIALQPSRVSSTRGATEGHGGRSPVERVLEPVARGQFRSHVREARFTAQRQQVTAIRRARTLRSRRSKAGHVAVRSRAAASRLAHPVTRRSLDVAQAPVRVGTRASEAKRPEFGFER